MWSFKIGFVCKVFDVAEIKGSKVIISILKPQGNLKSIPSLASCWVCFKEAEASWRCTMVANGASGLEAVTAVAIASSALHCLTETEGLCRFQGRLSLCLHSGREVDLQWPWSGRGHSIIRANKHLKAWSQSVVLRYCRNVLRWGTLIKHCLVNLKVQSQTCVSICISKHSLKVQSQLYSPHTSFEQGLAITSPQNGPLTTL